jgi:hypothetical protein
LFLHDTSPKNPMGTAFSKDGDVTTFFEKIPVAGLVVSGVHGLAGNEEEARRAAMKNANTLAVVGAGIAGTLVGGPGGAMAASAVTAAAMNGVEAEAGKKLTPAEWRHTIWRGI